jgi:hypothetical protein
MYNIEFFVFIYLLIADLNSSKLEYEIFDDFRMKTKIFKIVSNQKWKKYFEN